MQKKSDIVKPRRGILRNYDVLKNVAKDQLEYQCLDLNEDVELEESQVKEFEFLAKGESQKNNPEKKQLSLTIPNDLAERGDDLEIEIEDEDANANKHSIVENTIMFKKSMHLLRVDDPVAQRGRE